MRSFLTELKIIYKVEDNTVSASFDKSVYPLAKELIKHATYKNFYMTPGLTDQYILNLNGTAECKADDVFDLEYGKKLARKRLLKKFYKHFEKFFVSALIDAEQKVKMYEVMLTYFTNQRQYYEASARRIAHFRS